MTRWHSFAWPWLAVAALAGPLAAQTDRGQQIPLTPEQSSVALRTYGIGLLPLDGHFTRFHGLLRYAQGDQTHCSIELDIDAVSLEMATASLDTDVRGPDFLDVVQYPTLIYRGACDGDGVSGQLTMHGVTRPFALALERDAHRLVATGRLVRMDWGMTARPLVGGRTVRVTVTVDHGE